MGLNRWAPPPFNGISPPLLCRKIKGIKLISPCQWKQSNRENHAFVEGKCYSNKRSSLVDDIHEIQHSCNGLSLDDFQDRENT